MLKNYQDAIDRITREEPQLQQLLTSLNLTTTDLENFLNDERRYLDGIGKESNDDEIAISAEYVQLIDQLASAE
jgi:hypothetical protein